jgi:hypothetical protein
MQPWHEFDYIIVNDDVVAAANGLAEVVAGRGEDYTLEAPATRARAAAILAGHG